MLVEKPVQNGRLVWDAKYTHECVLHGTGPAGVFASCSRRSDPCLARLNEKAETMASDIQLCWNPRSFFEFHGLAFLTPAPNMVRAGTNAEGNRRCDRRTGWCIGSTRI